jgi:hypothetical protein
VRTMLAMSVAMLSLVGCVRAPCRASEPGTPGTIASCCGTAPTSFYWDGKACQPDGHCNCDATPAKPNWPTLEACNFAHGGCHP